MQDNFWRETVFSTSIYLDILYLSLYLEPCCAPNF